MKKLTALLLAVLLVLSLGITAYADETTNGTITVKGAENGETYSLYKIFDVTTVNGADAYSVPSGRDYSDTENFTNLFETTTATVGEGEAATTVTYVTRKTGASNEAIIAWAKDSIASFDDATTKIAADGQVVFSSVAAGYYYVKSPVATDAVAMIADTAQTATVVEKNSAPGWDDGDNKGGKTADGETYYAGDTITYTLIYCNAVNYDQGEQVTKYIIEDTLPEGITYNSNSLTVMVNNETVTTNNEGTVTNGFKVSIPWTETAGEVTTSKYTTNPSTITVTYTATMGNTKIAEGITNSAKIYPNTNENPGDEAKKEDTVYTGQIVLTKVDNSDNTKVLSGAKFKVKVGEQYLKQDGDKFSAVAKAEATEFVTGTDGKITLKGLKAGTYTFVETEAPAGYNLPENPEVASVTLELTTDSETGAVTTTSMSKTQQVNNSKAAAMPETGGMGTTMFYIVGSLLFVGAAVLLITQKRMRAAQ